MKTDPDLEQNQVTSAAAGSVFRTTLWSRHYALKNGDSAEQHEILHFLIRRYWKPVYSYLRRVGYSEEDAKDLVQDFFLHCLKSELFAKADPEKGRFRNLILTALKRFLAKKHRDAHARKRHPSKGFAYIDETAFHEEHPAALRDGETPDQIFHRAWIKDLVGRILKRLEKHCLESGKNTHFELFRAHVIAPALDGIESPSLNELGAAHGLSGKDAHNRILTVQRAFNRFLKDEIQIYALSEEEVAEEIQDLQRFLAR